MENLNFEQNENELDQNTVNADQTNENDESYATDGPVSESGAEGEDELSDLDEQTEGSDADQDETVEDDDAEDQLAGSDADYDTSVTTADLGALTDDESATADDDEEIGFESEGDDESEEKENNY
ncbi:hypothetical protein ACTJKC_16035 [Pedobacter sp. 22226]|uniref:hypothetical protein n=1 Tax=Pedobacter sp. 22226 TaxID=3453894 RepID=UPI003F85C028